MGLPKVDVAIQNGGLGLVSNPDDRVVGLVMNGGSNGPSLLLSAKQVFSYADFDTWVNLGTSSVTEAAWTFARKQVLEFYAEAGAGAELWVFFVESTATTADLFTSGRIPTFLEAADGRINVVGVSRYKNDVEADNVIVEGIIGDVRNALDEAEACALDYHNNHKPVRFIMDGRYLTTSTNTLLNLKTLTYRHVAVCISSTDATSKSACLGLLLGRIARSAVNQNIGRVKTGALLISAGYMTNGLPAKGYANATAVHDKGYIFLRTFPGRAGYYFNDDHMATSDTDDYFSLANGRVIDKAHRILYDTFLEEVLDTVPIDENGKILKTALKQYQEKAERAIGLTMGAAGEISAVECFIDPNQDILATSNLVIDVRVTPTATNRVITIKLGLFNPNVTA